jgi:hypothetical protein
MAVVSITLCRTINANTNAKAVKADFALAV